MKRRRLKTKRIAALLLILLTIIAFCQRGCISKCSSTDTEKKDSVTSVHLNEVLNNKMSDGKEYKEFDSLVESYLKRWEINGAQLVISRNDSLLYARGFGYADKEKKIQMQPNMVMRFASVSKLITAVGVMRLVEM